MRLISAIWRALIATCLLGVLTSCSNSEPSAELPLPTTIDSFGVAPNPVPANVAALFSWTVYGSDLVCKLDVEGNGTVDYTVTNCTSQSRVAHTFGEVGIFNARLTVTGADGKTHQKTTRVATSGPNTPPTIPEFTPGLPTNLSNPLAVNFNWVVADRDSDVTYCRFDAESDGKWEFSGLCSGLAALSGEVKGASSTGFSLVYPYPKPGYFEATLEAADLYEVVRSKIKVRAPWNHPPRIDSFKTTATGENTGQVAFRVSDPDDDPLECVLKVQSIGTFRYNNCRQMTRNFTFPDSGTFTVSLEVTDSYGAVSRALSTILFVPPPPPPVIIRLDSGWGGYTTCALAEDGRAYCWGENDNGQAGQDPATEYLYGPQQIGGNPSGNKWIEIAAGGDHSCGIRDDSTAWCWGNNENGQLGNNSTANTYLPVAVAGGHSFSQITVGSYFSCGLRTDNKAYCWGTNTNWAGQLGSGTYNEARVPIAVDGSNSFASISSGRNHTCGLLLDGSIKCWGNNSDGALGSNVSSPAWNAHSSMPVALVDSGLTGTKWISLNAGQYSNCGIRDDGSAWCWGDGPYGQLGIGAASDQVRPNTTVATGSVTGTAYTLLAQGHNHGCGLRNDGTAHCWGLENNGQLGNGAGYSNNVTSGPTVVVTTDLSGTQFMVLASGDFHTCGLRDDNSLWCWGDNSRGQLGVGASIAKSNVPVRVTFP